MVSEYKLNTDVIVASILHDIIEDTEVNAKMILNAFGQRIAEMVDRLTRDRPDGTKLSTEKILNNAYQKGDKEVLLIKLIDRLHNMQTIGVKFLDKQIKESKETLENFVSLAMYLENIKLEKAITFLCHKISSDQKKVNKIRFMYDFLKEDDNYQLPSLIG
jgi:(p)ppGpp synthase/HD superfamily hydrolase